MTRSGTRLYERIGFHRAAEYDIETGDMSGDRPLPPDVTSGRRRSG
ncbi:hypothetical protein ACIA03_24510 [Nocardioides sp. NPDC051685]